MVSVALSGLNVGELVGVVGGIVGCQGEAKTVCVRGVKTARCIDLLLLTL